MTDFATELVPIHCSDCKALFAVPIPAEDELGHDQMERMTRNGKVRCDTCDKNAKGSMEAATILARESARLTSWQTLCPAEFQKPIEWGRQSANRSNLVKLTDWTYGEKGLLVTGGPGRCKTRFIWHLLKREWNMNRTMNAVTHSGYRQTITALAATDQRQMLDWQVGLTRVQILFIDDLGKGRATPASEEGLFDLLDCRYRTGLPTVFTTNQQPEQIEASFSADYGPGIIRRVLDATKQIQF